MKKFIATILIIISLTSCGLVESSTAYAMGYAQGQGYKQLGSWTEVLESYDTEGYLEGASDFIPELTSEDIQEACDSMWLYYGLMAGLMNTPENKSDYMQGCSDGAK